MNFRFTYCPMQCIDGMLVVCHYN